MSVYVLGQLAIHDPGRYQRYADQFLDVLHDHDGKLLSADPSPKIVEGQHQPDKVVLLEFDDEASFNSWATSPDYTAIAKDRHAAATTSVLLLRGVPSEPNLHPTPPEEHDEQPVPEGFTRSTRTGPFIDLLGPLYTRNSPAGIILGLRTDRRHCNARGFVHGAVPVALCDLALGRNASAQTDPSAPLVTVSLTTEFIAPIPAGTWLETSTTIQRTGRRLAYAQTIIWTDEGPVAQASGVFAIIR